MAQIFDAFLELIGGTVPVTGETADVTFKPKYAIELDSFSFGSTESLEDDFKAPEGADASWDQMSLDDDDFELDNYDKADDAPKKIQHFTIDKLVDMSSPNLFQAYCSSSLAPADRHSYTTAKVSIRKNSGGVIVFIEFVFGDVYVTEYKLGTVDEGPPKETVTFSFRSVQYYYYPQDSHGDLLAPIMEEDDFSLVD